MIDLEEEEKHQQLRKLGQELHIPIAAAFWELDVFDKDGNLIQKHSQRSHSWVRNAYNLLLSQLAGKNLDDASPFGAGFLNIRITSGNVYDGVYGASIAQLDNFESSAGYRGPVAVTNYGIQVGNGTNPESFEDYKLQSLITNGTGGGQLNYVLAEVPTKSYDDPTKTFTINHIRYMNNNSGWDVDVNEVGLVAYGRTNNTSTYFMTSRDHLSATVTIPNTGQLKVTYTIQLTYPA